MQVKEWLDTQLGQDIWNNKYRYDNESFEGWLDRVSNGNQELRQLIVDKKFLFGGRTLTNYNTNKPGASTSNCYSSGYAPDSLEGLLELNKNIGLTYKVQGGQGLSLSKIRPKGSKLSTSYETDGIVPFMTIFNTTTASVSQGGSRKGALMMSLDAWHKEAPTFIRIKSQTGAIEKANLSLEFDDEFMEYVKKDYESGKETIVNRTFKYETGSIDYVVVPIKLYKEFCGIAHEWAEPGAIYTKRFRNYNLMEFDNEYMVITGNPCGEQPLPKDGACNLGSINLSEFVLNPYTVDAGFDWLNFSKAVKASIKSLDDVIDYGYQYHALQSQKDMAFNYRNIGLGVMGLGSMFFKLRLVYGSLDSITLIDKIIQVMFRTSVFTSNKLAREKGTFPKYKDVVFDSEIIKNHFTKEEIEYLRVDGLRNCSLLSVAPSGSIATMLNVTTGVEPAFRISYKRKTESLHKNTDVYYDVCIKEADEYKKLFNTDDLPSYFVSSESVNYVDRIEIQSVIQNHIDTAISSTVNVPNEFTVDDVEKLYILAWEKGLKGVTIYRDGCLRGGILTTGDTTETTIELPRGAWKPKAADTFYYERKLTIGCGKLKLFIGWSDTEKEIQDLYVIRSGQGGCEKNIQTSVIAMSGMLRLGGKLCNIDKAFEGLGGCNSFVAQRAKGEKLSRGASCGTAILNEIKLFQSEIEKVEVEVSLPKTTIESISSKSAEEILYLQKNGEIAYAKHFNKCPVCDSELENSGGCVICKDCGFSKCD
ncbi:ribonucleoside-diphosphate reductase, adenosylcobalamin-dependent [Clostridium sp. FP2]|uniref:ribonucleoside-diphosphate reductase, adenosylcobalamin-dependent n=1 Tax=Clostridium sp. FP2 TaxID=2724481 RepID=UPI0013E9141D|nr:ribonucleoside-diphosphate reductase, adenosylcobalamin-dependent [Clostridium sp. FP2]MBZ9622962.1 ribonucleoside-diphosphate reductase, adenosylcobalamin-dependent [Clostridium sp. FP2]